MLGEAYGVRKIIIACGRTDLRKGIDGLAQLVNTRYRIRLTKIPYFSSAGTGKTASKGCYGKETASCFYIKGWKTALFPGRVPRQRRQNLPGSSTGC